MSLAMAATIAALFGCGTYLLLQRSLTRIVLGVALVGHAANLLLLQVGGPGGLAPILGEDAGPFADPLPQALALTAIVITFGLTAFLLALAYRSWVLTADDEVEDDVEDRRIARRAAAEHERLRHLAELRQGIRPPDDDEPETDDVARPGGGAP